MGKSKKFIIIGIDEAGRGPLAGPVAVGGIMMSVPYTCYRRYMVYLISSHILKGIKDSKKLSAKQRKKWAKILRENFECHCVMIGSEIIDKIGIQKAIRLATAKVLQRFNLCPDLVLLDGLLSAPERYNNQQAIIKGDEKVPIISAASIIAKTTRDAEMLKLHKKFPQYCFDKHKGYGTKLHYKMIKKNGLSLIHRRSFCKNCKN